jgi:hypothetical protein
MIAIQLLKKAKGFILIYISDALELLPIMDELGLHADINRATHNSNSVFYTYSPSPLLVTVFS